MNLPIVARQRVKYALSAARDWYDEQRPGLGEEFLTAVRSTLTTIQHYPKIFSPSYGEVRRAIVSRFPYAVFYIVEPKRIVVLAVLHTSRDPKLWPRPRPRSK